MNSLIDHLASSPIAIAALAVMLGCIGIMLLAIVAWVVIEIGLQIWPRKTTILSQEDKHD